VAQDQYLAQFNMTDFGGDGSVARKQIDDWTFSRTRGKVREAIPPGFLSTNTKLVLMNAVYFKGNWATRFDRSLTRNLPFYSDDGISNIIPTMVLATSLNCSSDNMLNMLELPYVSNRLSMLLFLPKRGHTLKEIVRTFTFERMEQLMVNKRLAEANVYLPRFNIHSMCRLDKPLAAMGMTNVFSEAADFSGIEAGKALYIGAVLHDANIYVGEEGAEAAAVVTADARVISEPFVFRANHPFLFIIRDNSTGLILFIGGLSQPDMGSVSNLRKDLQR
jgi:serpin B